MKAKIKLGQEVTDQITGFTGIAVALTEFLYGCVRIEVQPRNLIENKVQETAVFDEPQLTIVGQGILPEEKPKDNHGDPTHRPTRHHTLSKRY